MKEIEFVVKKKKTSLMTYKARPVVFFLSISHLWIISLWSEITIEIYFLDFIDVRYCCIIMSFKMSMNN